MVLEKTNQIEQNWHKLGLIWEQKQNLGLFSQNFDENWNQKGILNEMLL